MALAGACSDPKPAPKLGKMVGESCQVSTECAAGLRCLDQVCANGGCSAATECQGTPPDGCATWACIAGLCESACLDASVPMDVGFPDTGGPTDTGFRDAAADSGVNDDAEAPIDAEPGDTEPAEDTGPDLDGGVPEAGPRDATAPDAAPDAGPADAGLCNPAARAPVAGDLIVNELLADPPDDANRDGTIDQFDDEFVELANVSSNVLELNGLVLYDSTTTLRHRFVARTLDCGKVLVVFGGGNTASPMWQSNWITASSGGISLNNSPDSIRVGTSTSTPSNIINFAYGNNPNPGNNQSLVRQTELSPAAAFILHTNHPSAGGRTYSAGTRVDGTAF